MSSRPPHQDFRSPKHSRPAMRQILTFGLGPNDKCPVDKEVSDEIVLTNNGGTARHFTFFVPTENEKFSCRLHPGTGVLRSGKSVSVHVYATLLMTTNVERKIKFEVEGLGSHLITIKLIGELSTKLDPDDIITVPPPIGKIGRNRPGGRR